MDEVMQELEENENDGDIDSSESEDDFDGYVDIACVQ